jgi:ATP-dependent Lhr-like helicase
MALKWLDRYAIVSRESWKNEQVVIPWRTIYRELRTMEMRGEVRRGYFVEGLSGAQFALPEALDALRQAGPAAETDRKPPWVVVAGADPANAWALPRAMRPAWPPRPGARSTLLVTRHGEVRVAAESRGRRLRLAGNVEEAELTGVLEALAGHVERAIVPPATRRREVRIEQIDGTPAASHPLAGAFEAAGFRRDGMAFRRLPRR